MLTYNNSDVVQCLRQYDMFANSLNLIKSSDERSMIIKQLTKLEEKIIALTNEIYEEEYNALVNKECALIDEEKQRINMLIELINQRLSYVEKRCSNHYQLTGESIDVSDVLGASTLDDLENRLRIIDKYSQNVSLEKELEEDIKSLTNKLSLASEKIDINKSLNIELETTFKKVLDDAFTRLELYKLLDTRDDIEYAYYEAEKSLTLAQLNFETAKTSRPDILADCQQMLEDISKDYEFFKDQLNTIKLIEIYDREVADYDELLNKRREVNDILKCIKNEELLGLISDVVNKQYSTITMEAQDINTFNDLALEKERKLEILSELREENESDEFQSVLKVLIENEKKKEEALLLEQQRIEEEEKKKKAEIERKKQEEILKRQKIIEEARKKEIEKRTKQLLEEQQNSILQGKKRETKVSFESIKDDASLEEEKKVEEEVQEDTIPSREEKKLKLDLNALRDAEMVDDEADATDSDIDGGLMITKNKDDIEKELFEEFNLKNIEKDVEKSKDIEMFDNKVDSYALFNDEANDEHEEDDDMINGNKLPSVSIDEYMRNFDESKVDQNETLNDFDDSFPSIPV